MRDKSHHREVGAAAGLILPAVLDIAPVMVPVTAVCWILLMIGAMITHARYGQDKYVALNFVYLAAAAFVAWAASAPSRSPADSGEPPAGRAMWFGGADADCCVRGDEAALPRRRSTFGAQPAAPAARLDDGALKHGVHAPRQRRIWNQPWARSSA